MNTESAQKLKIIEQVQIPEMILFDPNPKKNGDVVLALLLTVDISADVGVRVVTAASLTSSYT